VNEQPHLQADCHNQAERPRSRRVFADLLSQIAEHPISRIHEQLSGIMWPHANHEITLAGNSRAHRLLREGIAGLQAYLELRRAVVT
jgi:hypothetical protein